MSFDQQTKTLISRLQAACERQSANPLLKFRKTASEQGTQSSIHSTEELQKLFSVFHISLSTDDALLLFRAFGRPTSSLSTLRPSSSSGSSLSSSSASAGVIDTMRLQSTLFPSGFSGNGSDVQFFRSSYEKRPATPVHASTARSALPSTIDEKHSSSSTHYPDLPSTRPRTSDGHRPLVNNTSKPLHASYAAAASSSLSSTDRPTSAGLPQATVPIRSLQLSSSLRSKAVTKVKTPKSSSFYAYPKHEYARSTTIEDTRFNMKPPGQYLERWREHNISRSYNTPITKKIIFGTADYGLSTEPTEHQVIAAERRQKGELNMSWVKQQELPTYQSVRDTASLPRSLYEQVTRSLAPPSTSSASTSSPAPAYSSMAYVHSRTSSALPRSRTKLASPFVPTHDGHVVPTSRPASQAPDWSLIGAQPVSRLV